MKISWESARPYVVKVVALVAAAVVGAVAHRALTPPQVEVIEKVVEVLVPAAGQAPPPVFPEFGWVPDPAAVEAVVKTLDTPFFADTPAGKATFQVIGDDGDAFLWDASRKVTGGVLPARDQKDVGSCVGFGTASAVEHLLCVQIVEARARGLPAGEYKDLVQEVIYGGSRVQVGGGRIRGDGSIGAWAADFVRKWGVVPRGRHGDFDLTGYDTRRCREWGDRGVPDAIQTLAKASPVKSTALVKSAEEAAKAVRQGYPIAVCSNQGFRMQRDADGFCSPSGSWPHCMAIVGYQAAPRRGFFVLNSWGPNAHTGPRGKGDPSPAGFWADFKVVDRMLAQGDSWAFSDAVGFPVRRLDWFIRLPAPRPGRWLDRPAFALAW